MPFNSASDSFQLHPDIASYGTTPQACADVAAAIKAGYYSVGVAAGVETMTLNPMKWEGGMNPRVASSSDAQVRPHVFHPPPSHRFQHLIAWSWVPFN